MFKKYICFGLVGFMLLSVFGLVACNNKNEHEYARKRIKEITEIEVPNDSKILYHCRDEDKFKNGRRAQYTVFEFENEPTNWLKENAFLEGRNNDFEMYFTSPLGFLPVEIEEIPNEFYPEFENPYFWLSAEDGVYFFYCPNNLMLIVHIAGN